MQRTYAKVTFQSEGWHHWPNAPMQRSYLRLPHRHMFHVAVLVEVKHNEREIEFHDLRDTAMSYWPINELEAGRIAPSSERSCEHLAAELSRHISHSHPGRYVRVEVYEDGENGAIVETYPVVEAPQ